MTMMPMTSLLTRVAPLALVLGLAACVPPPSQPAPAPMPSPTPTPTPVETPVAVAPPPAAAHANWMDAPVTPGDWRWRSAGGDSHAEFRSPAGELLIQFTCTADRDVTLAIANRWPGASGVQVRTETQDRLLATDAREGWVEARLAAQDNLLDAIAFSRGRFALEVRGGQALYVPSYPEITRVVEDCR